MQQKIRKLGTMEDGIALLNEQCKSLNIVIYGFVAGKNISSHLLEEAWLRVISTDIFARSTIILERKERFFYYKGLIPVISEVSSDLDSLVCQQLNQPFRNGGSLLRCHYIRQGDGFDLVITIHHSIGDAASGLSFYKRTVSEYDSLLSSSPFSSEFKSSLLLSDTPNSLESLIKNTYGENLERRIQRHEANPVKIFERNSNFISFDERYCLINRLNLSKSLSLKVFSSCKKHKTTVHGLLCAVLIQCLWKIENINSESDFSFSCRSSVNLRERLGSIYEASDKLSMRVSSVTSFHSYSEKQSIWELAQDSRGKVKDLLTYDQAYRTVIDYSENIHKAIKYQSFKSPSVFISNFGKIPGNVKTKNVKLTSLSYCLSTNIPL